MLQTPSRFISWACKYEREREHTLTRLKGILESDPTFWDRHSPSDVLAIRSLRHSFVQMSPVENENDTSAAPSTSSEPPELTGRVDPVPMDGNCLFTAALRELKRLGLNGSLSTATHMRAAIMEWVQARASETKCAELTLAEWIMLETEESLENYVARLKADGEWGGIIELYALTEMFDVCTCVYEPVFGSSSRNSGRSDSSSSSSSSGSGSGSGSGERQRYARRHALVGRRASEREPKAPRVHLHYNGTSHYSVFVPDERVDESLSAVSSYRATALAAAAGAPSARTGSEGVAPAGAQPSTSLTSTFSAIRPESPPRHATASQHSRATDGGASAGSGVGSAVAGADASTAGARRPIRSARSERSSSERILSSRSRSSNSSQRQAAPKRRPTHPLPVGSLPVASMATNGRVLQQPSSRRRLTSAVASTSHGEQVLRPLASMRGSLSNMSQAVKLKLQLQRGGPLPTKTASRLEVRV